VPVLFPFLTTFISHTGNIQGKNLKYAKKKHVALHKHQPVNSKVMTKHVQAGYTQSWVIFSLSKPPQIQALLAQSRRAYHIVHNDRLLLPYESEDATYRTC
jgi:hypothetical protein